MFEQTSKGVSLKWLDEERPKVRADCEDGPRPCPWVMCRHHMYLEVTSKGGIRFNQPGKEVWELEHTCNLDLAEEGALKLVEVGDYFGYTRERARQVEMQGLLSLRRALASKDDE